MINKTKEFIIKAIKIHGYKYDYSLVEYVNAKSKVIIIDKKYGTKHLIRPHVLLEGGKCDIRNCIDKTAYFIIKANIVHNNRYDYSLVIYKGGRIKIIIIDKKYNTKHLMRPNNHLNGDTCCINNAIDKNEHFMKRVLTVHKHENYDFSQVIYKTNHENVLVVDNKYNTTHSICAYNLLSGTKCNITNAVDKNKYVMCRIKEVHGDIYDCSCLNYINKETKLIIVNKKYNTKHKLLYHNLLKGDKCCIENAIDKNKYAIKIFKSIHGDKYDYSLVNYIDYRTKLIIIDKKYNTKHLITFDSHGGYKKSGCTVENAINKSEYVVKRFKSKLQTLYGYGSLNYINNTTEVEITCGKHGIFKQLPDVHLYGSGCPKCNHSKGEIRVEEYLRSQNIEYRTQEKFKGCVDKRSLKFDFYLNTHNICIEYDGEFHYKSHEFIGGDIKLKDRKKKDKIKNKYCKDNNIKLLRIPYWDFDNIEKILKEELWQ